MHLTFGKLGVNIHNWPEGVHFPPINVADIGKKILGKSKNAKNAKKDGERDVKSIRLLPLDDLYVLALALRNEEHPLHFRIYTDGLSTGEFFVAHTFRLLLELADTLHI